jgi:hypothetical protein
MSVEVLIVAIASILSSVGACVASTITALHLKKVKYFCCDVDLSPNGSERGGPVININTVSQPPISTMSYPPTPSHPSGP